MGRQHQGMDRPGVRQIPEGSGEQGTMEKTGCKIICGAPTTLLVKELMMMMMMNASHWRRFCMQQGTTNTGYFTLEQAMRHIIYVKCQNKTKPKVSECCEEKIVLHEVCLKERKKKRKEGKILLFWSS